MDDVPPSYSLEDSGATLSMLPLAKTVVQYQPVPMRVDNCNHTVKAIFSSNFSVASLTNILGTYVAHKVADEKQRHSHNKVYGIDRNSKPEIRMYNQIMDKLETLSSKIVHDRRAVRDVWEKALGPFKLQIFAELYNSNELVRCFAAEIPDLLALPKIDDHALGLRHRVYEDNRPMSSRLPSGSPLLALLEKVRTVVLLDDSESMKLPGHQSWSGQYTDVESRWDQARRVLASIVPKVSQYNPYGVDLHFLNRSEFYTALRTVSEVEEAFNAGRPKGYAPTGQRVHDILDAYFSTFRYSQSLMPLNLLIITDGEPNDPNLLESTIDEHITKIIHKGYPSHQFGLEFVQVGDSETATRALMHIEEWATRERSSDRDFVGVTPIDRVKTMTPELLLAILISGIDARVNGYMRDRGVNVVLPKSQSDYNPFW